MIDNLFIKKSTDEELERDFENLKNVPCVVNRKRAGNKITDHYFFKFRAKTKVGKWSHYSAWNDKEQRKKILKTAMKLHNGQINKTSVLSALRMRYGSVNQFRPSYVMFLYCKFKAKKVLDFSAGWGGRLLGALASDIDYIGIDTNKNLKEGYKKMTTRFINNSIIKLIFKDSSKVDYSKLDYDFVFTSPPYYTLEKYQNMPDYSSFDDFNDKFTIPVVSKSYKYLKKGGWYCLNIPDDMYKVVNNILGNPNTILKYPISNRFNDGTQRYEKIYCWKK